MAPSRSSAATLQYGYVFSPGNDFVWFLMVPIAGVVAALLAQHHLLGVWQVAASTVFTIPHHFVTWLRLYGSPVEFRRWRWQLSLAPLLLIPATFYLSKYAPLALLVIFFLWDNQHSIMQQYGFGRIYDVKAQTGNAATYRFDYYLHWTLFVNMLIVFPIFNNNWLRLLEGYGITFSPATQEVLPLVSWSVTGLFCLAYLRHVVASLRAGNPLNPAKYVYLVASYFVWYYTAFFATSLLVWAIAHRVMHGSQYIVMVYFYNRNNVSRHGGDSSLLRYLGGAGGAPIAAFLVLCAVYTVFFWQMTLERNITPDFDILCYSLLTSFGLVHYYFDSFIWKVRRSEVRENL